jgi:hypothetical protein
MKTSKPHPSKTTAASTASNNNTNASPDATDDHGGDDIEVGIDEFLGNFQEKLHPLRQPQAWHHPMPQVESEYPTVMPNIASRTLLQAKTTRDLGPTTRRLRNQMIQFVIPFQ